MKKWIFIVLTVAFPFIIISATGQLGNPYHAHDDWFLHLPEGAARYLWFASTEGRWINYLWALISFHLTPQITYIAFTCLYALSVVVLTAKLMDNPIFPIAYLAFFFSPFIADISQWSASQIPAMAVLFLTALALHRIPDPVKAAMAALLGQTASFLTFPGVAPVILLYFSYLHPTGRYLRFMIPFFLLFASLLMALLIMSSANYLMNGYFGVEIASWRSPNPGSSFAALTDNLGSFVSNTLLSAKTRLDMLVLCALPILIGILDPAVRRWSLAISAAVVVIICYELAISLFTGVVVPNRARYWPWIAPLFICLMGLIKSTSKIRHVYTLMTIIFAVVGCIYWVSFYLKSQRAIDYYDSLVSIGKQLQSEASTEYIYYGDLLLSPDLTFGYHDSSAFIDYARVKHGIIIQRCRREICRKIKSLDRKENVFLLDGNVVFKFLPRTKK